jgi:hypothetical protein
VYLKKKLFLHILNLSLIAAQKVVNAVKSGMYRHLFPLVYQTEYIFFTAPQKVVNGVKTGM